MKSKVMDRPLFKGPAVPDDQVENVGIMQGFLDEEDDLESMLGRDEDEEYGDEDENNQAMERNPRTPEILMNNLRGDMRSMDARIEELADLVGYNAAMDTPEEVLMLLQPVLAKQGIGGLPAGGAAPAMPPQGMPPEMGGMPPEMGMPPAMEPAAPGAAGIEALMAPPAPPPMDQAPVQMAEGGYVQRFQAGSTEEGVTPEYNPPTPELLRYAQQKVMQPGSEDLKKAVNDVLPTYREILGGGDRNTMQGQALMDIAQAGLRLASGRNAQGANIAGGSFASQLASAAEGLPGKLAERAGQFQQEERAIKLAALKSAESNVESQRKLFSQIVKSAGQSPFGKGLMGGALSVLNSPLLEKYANGQTNPQETNLVETARLIAERPATEFYTDDKGFPQRRVTPGIKLPHVAAAFQQRQSVLGGERTTTPADTTTTTPTGGKTGQTDVVLTPAQLANKPAVIDPKDAAAAKAVAAARAADAAATAARTPSDIKLSDIPPAQQAQATLALNKNIEPVAAKQTLWEAHQDAIGLHRSIGRTLGRVIPFNIAGQLSTRVKQSASTIDLIRQDIVAALREDRSKLSNDERKEIKNEFVKLGIDYFQNETDYRNQVIALALEIDKREREAMLMAVDKRVTLKERNDQENRAAEFAKIKRLIGAPVIVRTKADADRLAPNQEYLVFDQEVGGFVRKFNDKKK